MSDLLPKRLPSLVAGWVRPNIATFLESGSAKIWLLSLAIGLAVGMAAIAFREGIGLVQYLWLSSTSEDTLTSAQNVEWYWILAAPIVGGIIVGQMLKLLNARRTGGVADVIDD